MFSAVLNRQIGLNPAVATEISEFLIDFIKKVGYKLACTVVSQEGA